MKQIVNITDVCSEIFAGGDAPKGKMSLEKNEKYTIPIYSNGEANDGLYGYTDVARVTEPSITISARGTIGYTSIRNTPFVPIVRLITITPNQDLIDIKYLYYVTQNYNFGGSGTSIPQLTVPSIKKYSFPLPDKEHQQYIVDVLDKVSRLIDLRKQQLSKLDELVKSRFIEMFGNAENKIPIGELCNVTGGYSFKSGDISNDGAIKILQIGNVYLDNVSWETTNYLPEGYDEKYSRFMLNEGDIVVALTRPIIQSLGNVKACIVKSRDLPCLLNQRVGRITVKEGKNIFLEFIYSCLMTDDFTKYVESCSIGCSQPNISTKDIENYLIPNAPYEEQKLFAEFKKQTEKLKLEIKESLEKLETLKKSLMQEYFG